MISFVLTLKPWVVCLWSTFINQQHWKGQHRANCLYLCYQPTNARQFNIYSFNIISPIYFGAICIYLWIKRQLSFKLYRCLQSSIAQSVQQLTTSWTVWGLSPGGGEIFGIRPERFWGSPTLSIQWILDLFSGGKAAGTWR